MRQRLRRVPAPVVDAGLAVALAVAIASGIRAAPGPGARPDAFAYALGLIIAALVLARRRWPLAVVLASSATLQVYYLSDYTSTYAAAPLSVAPATAWAAGHRHRWAWAACWAALIASVGYSLTLGDPRRHHHALQPGHRYRHPGAAARGAQLLRQTAGHRRQVAA